MHVIKNFPEEREKDSLGFSDKQGDRWQQCEECCAQCLHIWLVVCGMTPSDSIQWIWHACWNTMLAAETDLCWQTDKLLYSWQAWHWRDTVALRWQVLQFLLESQAWADTRTNTHKQTVCQIPQSSRGNQVVVNYSPRWGTITTLKKQFDIMGNMLRKQRT